MAEIEKDLCLLCAFWKTEHYLYSYFYYSPLESWFWTFLVHQLLFIYCKFFKMLFLICFPNHRLSILNSTYDLRFIISQNHDKNEKFTMFQVPSLVWIICHMSRYCFNNKSLLHFYEIYSYQHKVIYNSLSQNDSK